MSDDQSVEVLYTNWKGETRWRRVLPQRIFFGSTEYHPEPQWLLHALDLEKKEMRDFAMRGIQDWSHGPARPGG